ncbi:hypothetical protein TNCV_736481 [Trichonephila clavipes]|nr:hypothetical protein TNCV_736481 [Trichonephila clavipes]
MWRVQMSLNLSRLKRWRGVEVRRVEYRFRFDPCRLTMFKITRSVAKNSGLDGWCIFTPLLLPSIVPA